MPRKNEWQKVQSEKVDAMYIQKKDAAGAAAVELLTRWRSAQEKPLHSWIAHLEEDAGEIAQILATIVVLAKKVDDIDGKLWAVKTGMEGFGTWANLAEARITILEALLDDVCPAAAIEPQPAAAAVEPASHEDCMMLVELNRRRHTEHVRLMKDLERYHTEHIRQFDADIDTRARTLLTILSGGLDTMD